MKFGFSLAVVLIGAVVGFAPTAQACSTGDFICEKFKRIDAQKNAKRRATNQRRQTPRTRQRTAVTSAKPSEGVTANRAETARKPVRTSMVQTIPVVPPTAEIKRLEPGSISEAPSHISRVTFGAEDLMETAAAMCEPTGPHATRSIVCSVAVHRARIDTADGNGCSTSLTLRELTFQKTEDGNWVNEESISLCGGRLLRRAELFPVAVDGKPSYAMSEEYQMLGGRKSCAAPYLESRLPLKKSYMPLVAAKVLDCGKLVATN